MFSGANQDRLLAQPSVPSPEYGCDTLKPPLQRSSTLEEPPHQSSLQPVIGSHLRGRLGPVGIAENAHQATNTSIERERAINAKAWVFCSSVIPSAPKVVWIYFTLEANIVPLTVDLLSACNSTPYGDSGMISAVRHLSRLCECPFRKRTRGGNGSAGPACDWSISNSLAVVRNGRYSLFRWLEAADHTRAKLSIQTQSRYQHWGTMP